MDDKGLQLHRRSRLSAAVEHLTGGNVAAFGRLVGYRDGAFVRQMISGARVVSEKTVRSVEDLRGMTGWFSRSAEPTAIGVLHVAEAPATYRVSDSPAPGSVERIPIVTPLLRPGRPMVKAMTDDSTDVSDAWFGSGWLQRRGYQREQMIALIVKDGSMQPTLCMGDIVTVNTACTLPMEGRIYVANDEGICLVRRLVRDKGTWWLAADNAVRFPRKELLAPAVLLIGQVVHVSSENV